MAVNGFNVCLGCFVGGTGSVASWGWLSKSLIIHRLAWNTADEDDVQAFERAVRESTDFEQLATQWQRLYNQNSLVSSCWPEASKYEARIRVARRRVKDGMRLPPWGPPLLRGDKNPAAAHTPMHKRDEQEIRELLSKLELINTPLIAQLHEELANESREGPAAAQRLDAERCRLMQEVEALENAARDPGQRVNPEALTQTAERALKAQEAAWMAQERVEMIQRLHLFAQQMLTRDLEGQSGQWPNQPGHFVPCRAGPAFGAGDLEGHAVTPGSTLSQALSALPRRVGRNPGPGVPSPPGGDEHQRSRPRSSRNLTRGSSRPQSGRQHTGSPVSASGGSQDLVEPRIAGTPSNLSGTPIGAGNSAIGGASGGAGSGQNNSARATHGVPQAASFMSLDGWLQNGDRNTIHAAGNRDAAAYPTSGTRESPLASSPHSSGLPGPTRDKRPSVPTIGEMPEPYRKLSVKTGREANSTSTIPSEGATAAPSQVASAAPAGTPSAPAPSTLTDQGASSGRSEGQAQGAKTGRGGSAAASEKPSQHSSFSKTPVSDGHSGRSGSSGPGVHVNQGPAVAGTAGARRSCDEEGMRKNPSRRSTPTLKADASPKSSLNAQSRGRDSPQSSRTQHPIPFGTGESPTTRLLPPRTEGPDRPSPLSDSPDRPLLPRKDVPPKMQDMRR